jgi:rare lipoprotein A (peptidoglycan hydrolase)
MGHISLHRFNLLLAFSALLALVIAMPAHARNTRQRKPAASKQVTRASWYGKSFQGRPMASGGIFNPHRFTAAHRTIHLGSKVKVTELRSGRSVVVQITDRGPFIPGRGIDLSYAAARQLGIVRRGVARVRLELLGQEVPAPKAPVVTACSWPMSSWLPQAIAE